MKFSLSVTVRLLLEFVTGLVNDRATRSADGHRGLGGQRSVQRRRSTATTHLLRLRPPRHSCPSPRCAATTLPPKFRASTRSRRPPPLPQRQAKAPWSCPLSKQQTSPLREEVACRCGEPQVVRPPDGSVRFSTDVPGRVPDSYARYIKTVDSSGRTTGYVKETYDPTGALVHSKDKFGPGS